MANIFEAIYELSSPPLDIPNFRLIHKYTRRLPQFDYWGNSIFTTDIVFEYENQLYLLYANIECASGIYRKWYRYVNQVYPGLLRISDPTLRIVDSKIQLLSCEDKYPYEMGDTCETCGVYITEEIRSIPSIGHVTHIDESYSTEHDPNYLDYFGDASDLQVKLLNGTIVVGESLVDKMKSWYKTEYTEDDPSSIYIWTTPNNDFDRILWSMLKHDPWILSGK